MPREPAPFEFMDDDESPLPAPPEFVSSRENVPDLLEGDLSDDDVASAEELEAEEPELLDSALVTEVRPRHRLPPPIPAPVPMSPGRSAFIDDGEIALPPRITSQAPQSFPFRQLRRDEPPPADDDPTPDAAGWRSAALRNHAPEEDEAEELEADEVLDEAPPPPRSAPPPRARPSAGDHPTTPPSRAVSPAFFDDDETPYTPPAEPAFRDDTTTFAAEPAHPSYRDDDTTHAAEPAHPSFHDDEPAQPAFRDDEEPAYSAEAAFRDDDEPAPTQPVHRDQPVQSAFRDDELAQPYRDDDAHAAEPAFRDDDEPAQPYRDDDARAAEPAFRDDDEPAPTEPVRRDQPAFRDTTTGPASDPPRYRDPARMFADPDPEADDTVATRVDSDESSLVHAANPTTGLYHRSSDHQSSDAAPHDEGEPTTLYRADDTSDWVVPRPPNLSGAIPVAAIDDDDDDAAWGVPPAVTTPVPAPADATPVSAEDDWRTPPAPPADGWSAPASDDLTATPTEDETTWSPALVASDDAPAARPAAFSGAIPVADQPDDDDDEWVPNPPASSAPPSTPAAAEDEWVPEPPAARPPSTPAATAATDDDEWVPAPPATPAAESEAEDDDEWQPQTPSVNLAPIPTDLGEAFPLDLWSDPDELIGRELGRYRLIKPLTRGMATRVYAGESLEGDRSVAVRVLAPTYSPAEQRARQFLYEAQQFARLRSEHIVEILDTGTTSDHLTYYVMDLLDGDTLAGVVRNEGPIAWQDVAAFGNQICDALIVAANRGLVHSDLNSSTVIRLRPTSEPPPDGERRRDKIKLLDVGVTPLTSAFRNLDNNLALSQGTPPGIAEYMAPEIASGGPPDAHTQIYALGILLYELVTGRTPFRGESFLAVLKKQMYEEPVAPRLVVPEQDIPEAFEQIILKALAKAPEDRYPDLRVLDEALLAVRAREGELRRVTQILSLDPTDWDEEGSRKAAAAARPPSTPVRAAAEPVPLATFAADLKEHNPELAAKVFSNNSGPPEKAPGRAPSQPVTPSALSTPARPAGPSIQLTHLAAPVTAPPPVVPSVQPPPIEVHYAAGASPATSNNIRTISVAIIIACLVVLAILLITEPRGRSTPKGKQDVATKTHQTAPKTKRPKKTEVAEPDATPVKSQPEPVKNQPVVAPTKQPDPEPPTIKQPDPEPPTIKQPDASGLPDKIDSGRIVSKIKALEPRVRSSCGGKSGLAKSTGLKMSVRVSVAASGATKVAITDSWNGTPMGTCTARFLEGSLRGFNATVNGGSAKYTLSF
ncbi:MAG: protein kinase [Myxococcales bacterium]|nr:protein kinase [Myxococcales bacterium]